MCLSFNTTKFTWRYWQCTRWKVRDLPSCFSLSYGERTHPLDTCWNVSLWTNRPTSPLKVYWCCKQFFFLSLDVMGEDYSGEWARSFYFIKEQHPNSNKFFKTKKIFSAKNYIFKTKPKSLILSSYIYNFSFQNVMIHFFIILIYKNWPCLYAHCLAVSLFHSVTISPPIG